MLHVCDIQLNQLLISKSNPRMSVHVCLFRKRLHRVELLWQKTGGHFLSHQIKCNENHTFTNNRPSSTYSSGIGTGLLTNVRRWRRVFFFLIFIFLKLEVLHRVKNNLLVTGSWAKRILWSASVSPDGAHTGGAFLCLLLNFKTSSKCLSRVAIGGRVTSLSLIKLNPGIKFDNFSLKQREAILHATRRKLSPNLVEFTPLWIKVDLD